MHAQLRSWVVIIKLEAPMLDSGDTDASVTAIAVPCVRSRTSAVTSSGILT